MSGSIVVTRTIPSIRLPLWQGFNHQALALGRLSRSPTALAGRRLPHHRPSSLQVEVDADKSFIRVSKNLVDSPELQAIRMFDSDIRRYLYETCLPFEVGIHLLPLALLEIVDEKLREFKDKRSELVECSWRPIPASARILL